MVRVIPSKKTNETQRKQDCQLEGTKGTLLKETDDLPHQNRRQWLTNMAPATKDIIGSSRYFQQLSL